MDLAGKTALVTGAAVRVGRAIALGLARAGADVIVHYRTRAAEAEATAAEIRALGRRAATVCADLADPAAACETLLSAAATGGFGRLDVLVNNASVYEPGTVGQLGAERWSRMVAVNVTAPTLLAEAAIPRMPAGGAVVNILDILARRPWPAYLAYCQSKAALWAATTGLSRSAAPAVRVNGVAPGVVLWNERDSDPEFRARLIERIPLKRTGTPQDVAAAVRFLCENDYITGQVICVDGGRSD